MDDERSWGKWIVSEVRCPECLEYFDTDCFSKEEMNKCPHCCAIMREKDTGQTYLDDRIVFFDIEREEGDGK